MPFQKEASISIFTLEEAGQVLAVSTEMLSKLAKSFSPFLSSSTQLEYNIKFTQKDIDILKQICMYVERDMSYERIRYLLNSSKVEERNQSLQQFNEENEDQVFVDLYEFDVDIFSEDPPLDDSIPPDLPQMLPEDLDIISVDIIIEE